MSKTKAQQAQAKLTKAQADEAAARERGGGGPVAVMEAQARAAEAMDELYAAQQPEPEETVTLIGPNPAVNVTDSNGVQFENGVASGVPRSLAQMYVRELGGYQIQED
jgi:hypothetical protein